jgi:hypothetical protein
MPGRYHISYMAGVIASGLPPSEAVLMLEQMVSIASNMRGKRGIISAFGSLLRLYVKITLNPMDYMENESNA